MMLNGGVYSFLELPVASENNCVLDKGNGLLHMQIYEPYEPAGDYLLIIYYKNDLRDKKIENGKVLNYNKSENGYGLYIYSDYINVCVPNLRSEIVNLGEGIELERFFIIPNDCNSFSEENEEGDEDFIYDLEAITISWWTEEYDKAFLKYQSLLNAYEYSINKDDDWFDDLKEQTKNYLDSGIPEGYDSEVYTIDFRKVDSKWRINIGIKEADSLYNSRHPFQNIFLKEELQLVTSKEGEQLYKTLKMSNGLIAQMYYLDSHGNIETYPEKDIKSLSWEKTMVKLNDVTGQNEKSQLSQKFLYERLNFLNSSFRKIWPFRSYHLNELSYYYKDLGDKINSFNTVYQAFNLFEDDNLKRSSIIDTFGEQCEEQGHLEMAYDLFNRAIYLDEEEESFHEGRLENYLRLAIKLEQYENLEERIDLLEIHFPENSSIDQYKEALVNWQSTYPEEQDYEEYEEEDYLDLEYDHNAINDSAEEMLSKIRSMFTDDSPERGYVFYDRSFESYISRIITSYEITEEIFLPVINAHDRLGNALKIIEESGKNGDVKGESIFQAITAYRKEQEDKTEEEEVLSNEDQQVSQDESSAQEVVDFETETENAEASEASQSQKEYTAEEIEEFKEFCTEAHFNNLRRALSPQYSLLYENFPEEVRLEDDMVILNSMEFDTTFMTDELGLIVPRKYVVEELERRKKSSFRKSVNPF